MEYIILSMLGIIIVLLLVMMLKKRNDADIVDRMSKLELQVVKEIGEFKIDFTNDLRNDFDKLDEKIERKLMEINNKVTERLDQSLEKTNKTFANVLERLSKIDEAQKKIDGLSSDIISLQSVLTDKKTIGIFGEVNLSFILENAFGGTSSGIYSLQHKMSNGFIADALLFAPAPLGTIAIDSKFPLENYERMTNKNISLEEAILFLPAEAIFAEVNAYHRDILDYAYSKKVWITSPTTIMSMLTIISMVLKNMERDKYAQVIHEELNKLSLEFSRYKERWDKLARNIKTVSNSVEELNTTSDKITKRFDSINKVEVDKLINENKELVNS